MNVIKNSPKCQQVAQNIHQYIDSDLPYFIKLLKIGLTGDTGLRVGEGEVMRKNFSYFFIFTVSIIFVKISATDDKILNIPSQGKIIFVTGSCSSGKSSMAKIIAEKLNAKSYAFDEYVMPIVLKKFLKKHYGAFLAYFINGFVMRNFFTSVSFLSDKKKYELQKKFYNDLKEGMAIEPTSRMYKEVKMAAMRGQNVVVESPIYLWNGVDCLTSMKEFDGANVTYVLAYCPWGDLVNRIKQRNSSKNKKIHRELDWALINFIDNFEISSKNHKNNFLECLDGEMVHKTITEYSQPQYKKKRLHLMAETQNLAWQKFPNNTDYYIYPRFDYNITVNTKINTPDTAAAAILAHTRKVEP